MLKLGKSPRTIRIMPSKFIWHILKNADAHPYNTHIE